MKQAVRNDRKRLVREFNLLMLCRRRAGVDKIQVLMEEAVEIDKPKILLAILEHREAGMYISSNSKNILALKWPYILQKLGGGGGSGRGGGGG